MRFNGGTVHNRRSSQNESAKFEFVKLDRLNALVYGTRDNVELDFTVAGQSRFSPDVFGSRHKTELLLERTVNCDLRQGLSVASERLQSPASSGTNSADEATRESSTER